MTQQSVSRLEPGAFECIVRMCYAVLEACTEEQNYESAYRLLTFTGGFCTAAASPSAGSSATNQADQQQQKTIYMTERISIHPIFADLRLWERVLLLHQQDQQNNDRKEEEANNALAAEDDEDAKDGDESSSQKEDDENDSAADEDSEVYDSVVTTLYEMVGYNVPAEEVSRFATRISEEKGWFATEKGQALLVLARRLTAKRDEGSDNAVETPKRESEFSFIRKDSARNKDVLGGGVSMVDDAVLQSEEIAWNHPSTCLVSYEKHGVGARAFLGSMLGGASSEGQMVGTNSLHGSTHGSTHGVRRSSGSNKMGVLDANGGDYAGRVAITAMASFGGSAVVTGGIDGSIFLAHTINSSSRLVNGMQLQWGAKQQGGEIDRGDGSCSATGSVTCIAASKGSGYKFGGGSNDKMSSKPGSDSNVYPDEDEMISSMDGCWVIAGTTGGALRVWSLRDVFYASCMMHRESQDSVRPSVGDDFGMQDAVAGAPVGGHRGGVTCIDLPPRMYRPDSLVSGGEDGLIKLWSLKPPSSDQNGGASGAATKNSIQSRVFHNRQITSITDNFDTSDGAEGVLTGHEGKIICVKTAWHGDKLLSGGADRTVRLWDISGTGGGKPLTTLRGHQGWVTQTHFWGPNAIVSASTDRSILLWDTRIGSSPLFALRYHLSPVSDLLLGNRSEPLMVSAGADGSLATWDFRMLSNARAAESPPSPNEDNAENNARIQSSSSRTMRSPIAKMNHLSHSFKRKSASSSSVNCGSIKLARSVGRDDFSFFSTSDDGVVKEWEAASGGIIGAHNSGHRDAISGFATFSSTDGLMRQNKSGAVSSVGGTITCSWDGTVRLRRLSRKSAR